MTGHRSRAITRLRDAGTQLTKNCVKYAHAVLDAATPSPVLPQCIDGNVPQPCLPRQTLIRRACSHLGKGCDRECTAASMAVSALQLVAADDMLWTARLDTVRSGGDGPPSRADRLPPDVR